MTTTVGYASWFLLLPHFTQTFFLLYSRSSFSSGLWTLQTSRRSLSSLLTKPRPLKGMKCNTVKWL